MTVRHTPRQDMLALHSLFQDSPRGLYAEPFAVSQWAAACSAYITWAERRFEKLENRYRALKVKQERKEARYEVGTSKRKSSRSATTVKKRHKHQVGEPPNVW